MVDLHGVEIELQNARKARINAELACCDVEQLAAEIRQSHYVFKRLIAQRREQPSRPLLAGFHGFKTRKATEEERKTAARARLIRDFAIAVRPPISFSKQ